MSAKKKAAGKAAKRAKAPAKKSRAGAPKARASAVKRGGKSLPKRATARKATAKNAVTKKAITKKKPVPGKAAKAKPSAAKAKPVKVAAMKRRDGAGHLDPKYAADLRALAGGSRAGADRAFPADALSQELGEEFVETVTSGEDEGNEIRDKRVTEELGGPFTVTTGGTEFANGVDGSNPKRATREPFPRT